MAGGKTLPKTSQLLMVLTAAWEVWGPPSVDRVALTVAGVFQPPRFKLSRLASTQSSSTLNSVFVAPIGTRVIVNLVGPLMPADGPDSFARRGPAVGPQVALRTRAKARCGRRAWGWGSLVCLRPARRPAAFGQELLGKGAGMKGLPDFKGNSQNFESGEELGGA